MREIWLRPNRRAILFGCMPPLVITALGAWLLGQATVYGSIAGWLGLPLLAVGIQLIAMLLRHVRRPRLAYQHGKVLFYLRSGAPVAVPAEVVEAFFFGQGPTELPGGIKKQNTVNLVARLSQRHSEWASQVVKPALGHWCEGYVTIRGTWCEPLSIDVLRRINRRLKEVQAQSIDQPEKL
jgi:hypothetical protein